MKRFASLVLLSLTLSCSPSRTTEFFDQFKNEIISERLIVFNKYMPENIENRLLSETQFAPGYKAYGHSGINILFILDDQKFQEKKNELIKANILTNINLSDSCFKNISEESFDYVCDENSSLKIPNMFEYYCQEGGFCFDLGDFDITVLEAGVGNIYSREVVGEEYLPEKQLNYVVGAYISKSKNYINYWFFIY